MSPERQNSTSSLAEMIQSSTRKTRGLHCDQKEAFRQIESWYRQEQQKRILIGTPGRLDAVEELTGGRFDYCYNQHGDLSQIREANGAQINFAYDDKRRLIHVFNGGGIETHYHYDENDRLIQISDGDVISRITYDTSSRVKAISRGNAETSVYHYDAHGRIKEARTSCVSTQQEFDHIGRIKLLRQTVSGVALELRLEYDLNGRLTRMFLPGSQVPVSYQWDAKGRPMSVALGNRTIADFKYDDQQKRSIVRFANGLVEESQADPAATRSVFKQVKRDHQILMKWENQYSASGQILSDGARNYRYDPLDRLIAVEDPVKNSNWQFQYDQMDNRTLVVTENDAIIYDYDQENRLVSMQTTDKDRLRIDYNRADCPVRATGTAHQQVYRYNDANQLIQVLHDGDTVVRYQYDHKGRLTLAEYSDHTDRYFYGPSDELLAITDKMGNPVRLYIRTPFGLLAEIHGLVDSGAIYFLHQNDRGTCYLITDENGITVAQFNYSPFGIPDYSGGPFLPVFKARIWHPSIGMYDLGARWYNPYWGRFLTPDSYTGRPDDVRIVHPFTRASIQAINRSQIIMDWLKQPRARNRYAYCGNDPVNRADPNGHWSFGWMLLSILGAIWTLPNTILGLVIEITCLIGEVIRWLVWLISFGNVSWATPGFDAAASSHLNAFALVFKGGWFGSLPIFAGITFGNVFFVNKDWDKDPNFSGTENVYPSAYGGKVAIPKNQTLYEHELRHTNQYGWLGPFFLFGLPIWGVYFWDVIFNGYWNAWLERDARRHSGEPDVILP